MPLKSNLRAFAAGLPQAIDAGLEQAAHQVKQTRDPLVPVDTGDLLNSGGVAQVAPGHWEVREGDGLPDARAEYTEFGTATQAAQPHMVPAAEQNRGNLARNVGARIKTLADRSRV